VPEIKNEEEIKKASGRRLYRVKYVLENGETRLVEREMPREIHISTGTSDIVKNLTLWLAIALILFAVFNSFGTSDDKVSATLLKEEIVSSIQKGADLEVVKRIYENRKKLDKGIFSILDNKGLEYPYETPLSSVLEDIRADLFLGESKPDEGFVSDINALISSHNQKNPFDKLTKQQKDYFENVRQKTGDSYSLIQSDMNNISDELYSQSLLVETYLSDSRTSLYVSIFSLLFALIVSGYQIYQGRPSKVAENLKILLEGIFSQSNKEPEDLTSQASGTPKDGTPS